MHELFSIVLTVTLLCSIGWTVRSEPLNVSLVIMSSWDNKTDYSRTKAGPVIDASVEILNKEYAGRLSFTIVSAVPSNVDTCDRLSSRVGFLATEYYYRKGGRNQTMAFIGPGCSAAVDVVGLVSRSWNRLVISNYATNENYNFNDIDKYPTLGRVSPFLQFDIYKFTRNVLASSNYTRIAMVCMDFPSVSAEAYPDCLMFYRYLSDKYAMDVTIIRVAASSNSTEVESRLSDIKDFARVVIILAYGDRIRSIMLGARNQGMTDGEYVYYAYELYSSPTFFGNMSWSSGSDNSDGRDDDAQEAYKSLFVVSLRLRPSVQLNSFKKRVKEIAAAGTGYSFGPNEDVNPFAVAYHFGLVSYAMALTWAVQNGVDPTDANALRGVLFNRSYQILGQDIWLNDNGDRRSEFELRQFGNDGNFHAVLEFSSISQSLIKSTKTDGSKADIVWYKRDTPPPNEPYCGYKGNNARCLAEQRMAMAIALSVVTAGIFIGLLGGLFLCRKMKLESALNDPWWRADAEELVKTGLGSKTNSNATLSRTSLGSVKGGGGGHTSQMFAKVASYKGKTVAIKTLKTMRRFFANREALLDIRALRDLTHENLNRLVGIVVADEQIEVLTEYCAKGSLSDVLENDSLKLDWPFRFSLIGDIINGMTHLHESPVKSHGNLTSSNCVIDSRFVLKVTDFGMGFLQPYIVAKDDMKTDYFRLLWRAPEHLRAPMPIQGTQNGDIYSFGIIQQEIILRCEPYGTTDAKRLPMEPYSIIKDIITSKVPPLRPHVPVDACPRELYEIMTRAWAEEPTIRPPFKEIRSRFKQVPGVSKTNNIVDELLKRMETYASDLELLVQERTEAFMEEKRKSEELLYQVLPKSIAERLREGKVVEPEHFEKVSLYFSDIVSFTILSASSTPMQVVDLLNDLYGVFDVILDRFDTYKVETIGDAYMVVSGLPIRNGNVHVREIARMALAVLTAINRFKIRHRPEEPLRMRIGLHSGPVVAGVVGLKMPRYCLFGETVNIANKMESHGAPMRIHISSDFKQLLDGCGSFIVELRGEVEVKGKGPMITWWLTGDNSLQPS